MTNIHENQIANSGLRQNSHSNNTSDPDATLEQMMQGSSDEGSSNILNITGRAESNTVHMYYFHLNNNTYQSHDFRNMRVSLDNKLQSNTITQEEYNAISRALTAKENGTFTYDPTASAPSTPRNQNTPPVNSNTSNNSTVSSTPTNDPPATSNTPIASDNNDNSATPTTPTNNNVINFSTTPVTTDTPITSNSPVTTDPPETTTPEPTDLHMVHRPDSDIVHNIYNALDDNNTFSAEDFNDLRERSNHHLETNGISEEEYNQITNAINAKEHGSFDYDLELHAVGRQESDRVHNYYNFLNSSDSLTANDFLRMRSGMDLYLRHDILSEEEHSLIMQGIDAKENGTFSYDPNASTDSTTSITSPQEEPITTNTPNTSDTQNVDTTQNTTTADDTTTTNTQSNELHITTSPESSQVHNVYSNLNRNNNLSENDFRLMRSGFNYQLQTGELTEDEHTQIMQAIDAKENGTFSYDPGNAANVVHSLNSNKTGMNKAFGGINITSKPDSYTLHANLNQIKYLGNNASELQLNALQNGYNHHFEEGRLTQEEYTLLTQALEAKKQGNFTYEPYQDLIANASADEALNLIIEQSKEESQQRAKEFLDQHFDNNYSGGDFTRTGMSSQQAQTQLSHLNFQLGAPLTAKQKINIQRRIDTLERKGDARSMLIANQLKQRLYKSSPEFRQNIQRRINHVNFQQSSHQNIGQAVNSLSAGSITENNKLHENVKRIFENSKYMNLLKSVDEKQYVEKIKEFMDQATRRDGDGYTPWMTGKGSIDLNDLRNNLSRYDSNGVIYTNNQTIKVWEADLPQAA